MDIGEIVCVLDKSEDGMGETRRSGTRGVAGVELAGRQVLLGIALYRAWLSVLGTEDINT